MSMINCASTYWGIAHSGTGISGSLFTDKLFTFRHQAEAYISEAKDVLGRSADGMHPVLVQVTTTICSEQETAEYHSAQSEWLRRNREGGR